MVHRKWTEAKVFLKKKIDVHVFRTEFEMAVKNLLKPQRHTSGIFCVECFAIRSTQHKLIELRIGKSR